MCRHALPRFDLHLGHTLHQGAAWVGLHPTLTVACAGISASVLLGAIAYPDVRRSVGAWMDRVAPHRALGTWRSPAGPAHPQHPG